MMTTRRRWLMQLGGGVVLAGCAGDLDAAELPPGVYEASREHLDMHSRAIKLPQAARRSWSSCARRR